MRALVATVALFVVASPVNAHGLGEPWIHVPADYVMPGEPFQLIAADLGSDVDVTVHVVRGNELVPISVVHSDTLGHFEATLELPTDFPHGRFQLLATGTDGSEAATWLIVGPVTEATTAPPVAAAGAPDALSDPSVLLLGAVLVGGAAALAYAVVRRRQPQQHRPAPARSRVSSPAGRSKRTRRRTG